MAAQAGAVLVHEKVSRLLNRQVLKPNRPLVLKNVVANRKLKKGEATCVTEMSVLMACWKLNNFVEDLCSEEVKSFYTCVDNARMMMKNKSQQSVQHGGHLHPKQATSLLKRFPNQSSEI